MPILGSQWNRRQWNRRQWNRRQWMAALTAASAIQHCPRAFGCATKMPGAVVGQISAEKIGMRILEQGGNAMDAIVAAALASAIAAPSSTGIGGYGLSAVIAYDGGTKWIALDANTMAPKSMPKDIFQRQRSQHMPAGLNANDNGLSVGWLSVGVPGILAGLQLIVDRFCTKSLDELLVPAIGLARDGIIWPKNLTTFVGNSEMMQSDEGSRKLYLPDGNPVRAGDLFKNPELAELLSELASKNSVKSFYQGDIAQNIADAFRKHEGLVTADDLAEYQARWVEPYTIDIGPYRLHTAPLSAGGLTVLQMLRTLDSLRWNQFNNPKEQLHARVETMRIAWRDRLALLGDPAYGPIPVDKLLSKEYAEHSAAKVQQLVKTKSLSQIHHQASRQTGTIHLSATDSQSNYVSLTLTHGNGFGAGVTVDGLGLTLGHGMSRFDAHPDHPNGPAPGKRPLHNMIPTIVSHNGRPIIAIGGTGGRKIPNALFDVLTSLILQEKSIFDAVDAPRINTDGSALLSFDKKWNEAEIQSLRSLGYQTKTEGAATMHAVSVDEGNFIKASR